MYYKINDDECYKIAMRDKTVLEVNKDDWYIDEVQWPDNAKTAKDISTMTITIRRKA